MKNRNAGQEDQECSIRRTVVQYMKIWSAVYEDP